VRLGLALKYYRLKAGIKQKELARRVGISPAYLSLLESGRRATSLDLLERISEQLGVPIELLLLEARQNRGELSPLQLELFDRAKRLFLLASSIEHDASVQGAEDAAGLEARTAIPKYPHQRALGAGGWVSSSTCSKPSRSTSISITIRPGQKKRKIDCLSEKSTPRNRGSRRSSEQFTLGCWLPCGYPIACTRIGEGILL